MTLTLEEFHCMSSLKHRWKAGYIENSQVCEVSPGWRQIKYPLVVSPQEGGALMVQGVGGGGLRTRESFLRTCPQC